MSAIPYRADIQGLRAIAVLAVMAFHFNPAWLPGGFIGVDVFLVISGFLIVNILLTKKQHSDYQLGSTLQYFYGSRLKRIAPAYFAMLALVSLCAAILFLPQDLATYRSSMRHAALFFSNQFFANFGDYFAPATHEQPLLHTWSLAVELQFYLLAPFLVLLLPARALKWVFITLLIGLTALAQYRLQVLSIQQATYYSLYARLPEFFAGGLVALSLHSRTNQKLPSWAGMCGLTLILVSAVAQPQFGSFPGWPALMPVSGAALLLLQTPQKLTQTIVSNRPIVWAGELSYSLYLWHWPVLALLRYYTGVQILDFQFSLLFIALTITLATLSFYGIETPCRTIQVRAKQVGAYGALALATLSIGLSIKPINHFFSPPPLPIEYERYADPVTICHGQIVGDCLKGDLNSNKEVLVLGDSHAAMLNLFFDRLGKELGFKARIITASSCVTIPGFDYQRLPEWARQPCLAQIKQAAVALNKTNIIFIAAKWDYQLESPAFSRAFDNFLQQTSVHKRIYLMPQIPKLSTDPLRSRRLAQFDAFAKPPIKIDQYYEQANIKLAQHVNQYQNIKMLDTIETDIFVESLQSRDAPLYSDKHHLNEAGAIIYTKAARAQIEKIMR